MLYVKSIHGSVYVGLNPNKLESFLHDNQSQQPISGDILSRIVDNQTCQIIVSAPQHVIQQKSRKWITDEDGEGGEAGGEAGGGSLLRKRSEMGT